MALANVNFFACQRPEAAYLPKRERCANSKYTQRHVASLVALHLMLPLQRGCCAPKLLHLQYGTNYNPLGIAGNRNIGRRGLQFYPLQVGYLLNLVKSSQMFLIAEFSSKNTSRACL